jgi:hypothetical protein
MRTMAPLHLVRWREERDGTRPTASVGIHRFCHQLQGLARVPLPRPCPQAAPCRHPPPPTQDLRCRDDLRLRCVTTWPIIDHRMFLITQKRGGMEGIQPTTAWPTVHTTIACLLASLGTQARQSPSMPKPVWSSWMCPRPCSVWWGSNGLDVY